MTPTNEELKSLENRLIGSGQEEDVGSPVGHMLTRRQAWEIVDELRRLREVLEPVRRLVERLDKQFPPYREDESVVWPVYSKPLTVGEVRRIVAVLDSKEA